MPGLTFNFMGHDVSATSTLRRIDGAAEGTANRVGGHFKKLAGAVAGAFAGGAVVGFLKDSIAEATESQKVGAQTTAVLKSTGGAAKVTAGEIGNLATAISNKVGIDDEAIQSGENLLLTFTNVRNEAGRGNDIFNQTTRAAVDLSKATGTSLNGAFLQLGKAINDPVGGMTKLQRVGVSFTAQQKATNKALVEGGDVNALNALGYNVTSASLTQLAKRYGGDMTKAIGSYTDEMTKSQRAQFEHLTEGGHAMEAQKNILREVNKEFGGSAAAQVTPAEKAAVAWGNLKEQIGTYLLPMIAKLATFLTQKVIPALVTTVGWVTRNASTLKMVALYLLPIVAAWAAYSAITRVVAVAQAALNLVMEANPIVLIVTAIIALVAAMVIAYKRSETFRKIVQTAFSVITTAAKFMWDRVLKPIFGMWKTEFQIVSAVVQAVASALVTAWRGISTAFSAVWAAIKTIFGWIKTGVQAVGSVVHTVSAAIGAAWGLITAGLRREWQAVSTIYGWVKSGIHAVSDVVHSVGGSISSAFSHFGDGLSWLWHNVISPVFGWIRSGIRGVRDVVHSVSDVISGLWSHLTGGLQAAWRIISKIFGWIKSGIATVASVVGGTVQGIEDALNGLSGKTIGSGIKNLDGTPLGHNAQGTGFWRGGSTVVGEFGPEVVDLPRGSKVHTASQAGSMGGGGGDTYISVTLPNAVMTQQDADQLMLAAVTRAQQRRGGAGSTRTVGT